MKHDDIPCDRRQFLAALRHRAAVQGHALRNELRGVKMMDLDDLDEAPDEIIQQMIPVVRPGLSIRIDAESVLYVTREPNGQEETVRLLAVCDRFIYEQIDGIRTNNDIANALAGAHDMSEHEAYEKTRGFFIEFARRMICQPATA